jgi:hypothetical protein
VSPRAKPSAPLNPAIGQVSRPRKPRIDRVRILIFWSSALAAAAVLAGVAYWGCRHLQPRPLFAQTGVNAENSEPSEAVSSAAAQPATGLSEKNLVAVG